MNWQNIENNCIFKAPSIKTASSYDTFLATLKIYNDKKTSKNQEQFLKDFLEKLK